MSVSGRDRDPAFRRKTSSAPSAQPAPKTENNAPKENAAQVTPKKVDTENKTQQENKPSDPNKTSKKSKLMGVIVALIFLLGIGVLGYYIITSILNKEQSSTNTEHHITVTDEEHEANAGDVNEASEENPEGDAMRETTLNEDNSLEGELNANEEVAGEEIPEETSKQALSNVIRKKGDFEIPCWIIAFSANNKKPLANMNYSALEALGYDAGIYWIPKYFPGGQEMYKVYVGPYKSSSQADDILPEIRKLQPDAYVLKIDE